MKKAILNDGFNTFNYNSLDELEKKLTSPYTSFTPLIENNGLLIGKGGINIGTYHEINNNERERTNLDDYLI